MNADHLRNARPKEQYAVSSLGAGEASKHKYQGAQPKTNKKLQPQQIPALFLPKDKKRGSIAKQKSFRQ